MALPRPVSFASEQSADRVDLAAIGQPPKRWD
jgi:hypothetical protein